MNDGAISRDDMLELVALYALGVLPREETALVAAFIANDDEARREYVGLRAAADSVALSADEPVDSATSARMKERLLARVKSSAAAPNFVARRSGTNATWLWGAGLAAAAAVVFSFATVLQDISLRGELAQNQRRTVGLTAELAQAQRAGQTNRQTLTDLVSPDAKRYDVADGSVVVRGEHVYLALSKLPALPKGKVYEAWTLPRGTTLVQPSLTFSPNADGVAVVALPVDATKLGAVAVTVEPEGGSKTATSKPTFVRPLS